MASEVSFTAGPDRPSRVLLDELGKRFRVRRHPPRTTRRTYLDTFDWRLYGAGDALSAEERDGEWTLLLRRLGGEVRQRLVTGAIPAFAWDVESATMREELSRVIDVRRLLPVVHVETHVEELSILGARDESVVRVQLERGHAVAGDGTGPKRPMAERVRVSSVQGFSADHAAVVRHLEQNRGIRGEGGGELLLGLSAVGASPGSYSSKLDIALQPTMRADEAVLTILRRLFETMRANEDGTRRGLDSEFLHDFRVAARRTRSCLGQVKGVFEKEASRRFRREFAWLGEVTGPTRDLDVFLLQMREHRIEQTESLRSGLEHAAEYLRDRQKVEQRRLAGALASERYMKLTRDWSAFLERAPRDDGEGLPPDASRPATEVASERIWRAFRRVFKRGNALEPGAPPEAIHRLRIDCKKLRYLMEFFKSLFLREQISSPIRALRRLQDCLGDYNDLEMQQGELRKIAAELQARGDATAGTLLAVDSLIGTLGERQKKMKGAVIETVAAFVENRNRAAFRELLR